WSSKAGPPSSSCRVVRVAAMSSHAWIRVASPSTSNVAFVTWHPLSRSWGSARRGAEQHTFRLPWRRSERQPDGDFSRAFGVLGAISAFSGIGLQPLSAEARRPKLSATSKRKGGLMHTTIGMTLFALAAIATPARAVDRYDAVVHAYSDDY